jgi:hypothetical protein
VEINNPQLKTLMERQSRQALKCGTAAKNACGWNQNDGEK